MIVRISQGRPFYQALDFIAEPVVGLSYLGTPLYDKIVFPAGSYENQNGETISYEKLVIDDVLINVNLQRNISITKIAGREGSVKEFISNGDYEISFTGRITAPYQFQPTDKIFQLNQIFRIEQELPIFCKYLNEIYNITDIVIVGKPQISQVEGSRNTIAFTFTALSYEDITLEVLDDTDSFSEVGFGIETGDTA